MSRAGGIPGLKSGRNKDFPEACISLSLLSGSSCGTPGEQAPWAQDTVFSKARMDRCLNFSQPQFPCLKHVFTPM